MLQAKLFTSKDPNQFAAKSVTTLSCPEPEREPVLILVIGSVRGIDKIVHTLYQCRFAEVKEWSRLLPAQTPGKLMRSLIRYVFLD